MELQSIFTILIVLIIVLIVLAFFILAKLSQQSWNSQNKQNNDELKNAMQHMWDQLERKLNDSTRQIDEKLFQTSSSIDKKLEASQRFIGDNMSKTYETSSKIHKNANDSIQAITEKISKLEETNSQIKDIGWQLRGLENILKNPKQRGNLGEYFLKELLENTFAENQFALQHPIWKAWIVDAALFLGWKTIPIDAKFPHENYDRLIHAENEFESLKFWKELKKDIKKRIDEVAKYIVPEQDTTDFAFMLIPAEWMYYDIFISRVGNIQSKEIIEYSFSKKVIICAPSSFYAYLQTVMQWMKALKIEDEAKEIQRYVIKLQKDLEKYEEVFNKVWASLWTTVSHYNNANKRLEIIDTDIYKLTNGQAWGQKHLTDIEKPVS